MTNETFHKPQTTILLRRSYPVPVMFADLRAAATAVGHVWWSLTKHDPSPTLRLAGDIFRRKRWSDALKQVTNAIDEVYAVVDGREVRVAVANGGHAFEVVGEADKLTRVLVDSLLTEADEQGYWERPREIRMDLASDSPSLESTATEAPIQRLDYSKPPPGYAVFKNGARWYWSGGTSTWDAANQYSALVAAWADYKAHNDPPGGPESAVDHSDLLLADFEREVRVAAWARYDRRLAVHARVADDPRHRIDFCGSCGVENEPQDDDECPACGSTSCLISTWGEQQADRYRTSERYTANDPSIDDASPTWPAILSWSDDQVAEVECWLIDSTVERPAVLDGPDDDGPHVCTGCIGDGPCDAEPTEERDELAELEAEIDAEDEFMDDGLCSPMPQREWDIERKRRHRA